MRAYVLESLCASPSKYSVVRMQLVDVLYAKCEMLGRPMCPELSAAPVCHAVQHPPVPCARAIKGHTPGLVSGELEADASGDMLGTVDK